jgi:hypothetical protein
MARVAALLLAFAVAASAVALAHGRGLHAPIKVRPDHPPFLLTPLLFKSYILIDRYLAAPILS